MPTFRASDETMELLRVLRSWTELSELLEPNRAGPVKKYSLDAALLKALRGMDLPLELPKEIVDKIKKGEKVVLTGAETGPRRGSPGGAGKKRS